MPLVAAGVREHRYPVTGRLGRHQLLDARSLPFVHRHQPHVMLRRTAFEPRIPVLDQGDLIAQGIDTSVLIPGAPLVDSLGSCTANAAVAALSRVVTPESAKAAGLDYSSAGSAEEWAIRQYVRVTAVDQYRGQWPSEDTGSSGLANAKVLRALGLIGGYRHATSAAGLAGLLQADGVMLGMPWYEAWFEPDSGGFIDADPRWESSGVSGGHQVYATGLESVAQDHAGRVVPEKTVVTVRNSWSASWSDQGHFRVRLSTLYGPAVRPQLDAIQLHA